MSCDSDSYLYMCYYHTWQLLSIIFVPTTYVFGVIQGGKGSLVKCFVERIVEDATDGDLKCPECGSEFARPAMIRGKPANKIIGGKVIMRK